MTEYRGIKRAPLDEQGRKPLGANADRVKRLVEADPDMTAREIALALGLSTQRVYQLINALENRGELDMKETT